MLRYAIKAKVKSGLIGTPHICSDPAAWRGTGTLATWLFAPVAVAAARACFSFPGCWFGARCAHGLSWTGHTLCGGNFPLGRSGVACDSCRPDGLRVALIGCIGGRTPHAAGIASLERIALCGSCRLPLYVSGYTGIARYQLRSYRRLWLMMGRVQRVVPSPPTSSTADWL